MRSRHLLFYVFVALVPSFALAKSWQGVSPGVSTQSDVTNRFGAPSTKGKLEGQSAIVYKGDQAIPGTKQAQFLCSEEGIVTEINVFPAAQLDREAVEGTYGKSAQKTFTEDFRTVWIYRSLGVLVFFGKDGFVEAIRFKAPETGAGVRPTTSGRAPAVNTRNGAAPSADGQPQEKAP